MLLNSGKEGKYLVINEYFICLRQMQIKYRINPSVLNLSKLITITGNNEAELITSRELKLC